MSSRGSSLFAALAGIGAFFVAYGVASGIGLDLWTSGRLVFPFGPPRLEPTLAVGALAGAFVGFRLGGWRGALGPVLFALASVIGGLRFFIPHFQCAFGDAVQCRGLLDLDFVIPQLWLVPGFLLGVLLALLLRPRIPFRTELEAAGVFAFTGPISYLFFVIPAYLPFFQGSDRSFLYVEQLTLLNVGVSLVAAVVAAALLIRRAKRPRQAGLALTIMIAMLALPQLTYQIRYPVSGVDLIERVRFLPSAAIILAITLVWGPRRGLPVAGQRAPETSST